ncbi:PRC-barrel domain-containing protein [Desulforamulus ruminis]|uniref:PRC-barrel domain-containing protein n=1 Tax=Desulforamulus ruminis TaxID=1564 RepID=UPI002355E502|nr:PRC-barrel domain-containing protein [Desulforamulus ruminis]
MKLKNQIVGLPVLSIAEVALLGKVEDLIIHPETGSVDYLMIEPETWYMERRLISFKDITGIGQDALTTETKTNVVPVTSVPAALDLLNRGVQVVGSRVITRKGRIKGTINELAIDDETGRISACRWESGGDSTSGYIPSSLIITFGKELLVVEEDFEAQLSDSLPQTIQEAAGPSDTQVQETVLNEDPMEFFEEKQKEYLLGRTVTADILTENGESIARQGDKVTREILDRAVAADKFVELTLNTCE